MRRSVIPALVILVSVSMLAAGCGDDDSGGAGTDETPTATDEPPSTAGEDASGGALTVGKVEPTFIDSFGVQDSEGYAVARLLYDGLTDFDENLDAIPAVAESWTSSDDGTVWTFDLRPGTTFHNGEPVTAQSFIDAFNYLASPEAASGVASYGLVAGIEGFGAVMEGEATEISGLEAPDETTLVITLDGPNPLLAQILAHPAFSPRPQAALDDPVANLEEPIGNGPYQMVGPWQHNVRIDLERFADYDGRPGNADTITFRLFDSVDTMYLETQAGNVDISNVPPTQINAARNEFGDRYLEVAVGALNYIGIATEVAPFDDPELRRALSLAIDRETIAEQIFAGARDPADGFYPPQAPGGEPGGCANCQYDPELARQLYDEAGGIPGGEVTLSFNTGGGIEDWIQAVANNWKQALDLDVTLDGQEFAPYVEYVTGDGVEAPFRLGWGWTFPHAMAFLQPLFSSSSTDNLTGYDNPEVDALFGEFGFIEDPNGEEAVALIRKISELLDGDMPLIPVYFGRGQRVHTERVENVVLNAFDFVELEDVVVSS